MSLTATRRDGGLFIMLHTSAVLLLQVAYPFMHLAFQLGDFNSLLQGRTVGAELLGASTLGECPGMLTATLQHSHAG
jgi:hypothetical protein